MANKTWKLATVLVVMSLVLGLAACAKPAAPTTPTTPTAPTTPTTPTTPTAPTTPTTPTAPTTPTTFTPAPPAVVSFAAKTATDTKNGYSYQYPAEWVERPELLTTPYHQTAFGVAAFIPAVVTLKFDAAPETKEWILQTYGLMKASNAKVLSDIKEETTPEGLKAYTYKVGYISGTGYAIEAYVMDVDRDATTRYRIQTSTITEFDPYNEALFSEIDHSIRFQ